MDTIESTELRLFIENDYRSWGRIGAAFRTLDNHHRRGRFDGAKALALLEKVVAEGAKAYTAECGSPGDRWFDLFDVPTRRITARYFVLAYLDEVDTDDAWWRA